MIDMTSDYQRCAAKIGKNVGVTARTIREKVTHLQNDPRSFVDTDVKELIRENPGASLLVAAGAGLLIGRALRRL